MTKIQKKYSNRINNKGIPAMNIFSFQTEHGNYLQKNVKGIPVITMFLSKKKKKRSEGESARSPWSEIDDRDVR